MAAWTIVENGISLTARVTPKGGRDRIDGLVVDSSGRALLALRVSVAATNGAATDAAIALVAAALKLPKRNVTLVSGATARVKRLLLIGDGSRIADQLEALTRVNS